MRQGRAKRWLAAAPFVAAAVLVVLVSGCPSMSIFDLMGIGKVGPAGGIVFYDKGDYSDGWRYLEAAPASTELAYKRWGEQNTLVGGTWTGIGTGAGNTQAIFTRYFPLDSAAKLCADFVYGGHDDWFLPSKDELNLMYGQKEVIGGFSADIYWSSSEGGSYNAWYQNFADGYQGYDYKSYGYRVRAVRTF